MGLYIYITELDRRNYKTIPEDKYLNEELQEALKYDSRLLVSSYKEITKHWFKKDTVKTIYTVYHDVDANRAPYQACEQFSGSGDKRTVLAYLHGIINGGLAAERK